MKVMAAADLAVLLGAAFVVGADLRLALGYALLCFTVLLLTGEYRHHWIPPIIQHLPQLVGKLSVPLFGLALVGQAVPISESVLLQAPVSAAMLVPSRMLVLGWIRRKRRRGCLLRNTVVLGAGAIGAELAELLRQHPEHGLRPVGIIDDLTAGEPDSEGLPLLGVVSELKTILAAHDITHLVVAFGLSADENLVKVLRSAVLDGVDVVVVPRLFEMGFLAARPELDSVLGIPLLHLRRGAATGRAFVAKRVFDVVVAATFLVAMAPFLAVIAVAVRLSSPGPVLFRQRRVGQNGRVFEMLKFRTMRVNSDSDTTWSVGDDDRLTVVGRLLRPLSLDELPQFWNVFVGDMALVGPRPERPHFVDLFGPGVRGYADRHRLPVGLTGLAQVHGMRGDTSIDRRVRLDNYYIEHWSAWQDLCILLATAGEVWRNAHADVQERTKRRRSDVKVG